MYVHFYDIAVCGCFLFNCNMDYVMFLNVLIFELFFFFFFKQKTAYEMRISDWSSDVCSSDLHPAFDPGQHARRAHAPARGKRCVLPQAAGGRAMILPGFPDAQPLHGLAGGVLIGLAAALMLLGAGRIAGVSGILARGTGIARSEGHTSELTSPMPTSYAVFCLT